MNQELVLYESFLFMCLPNAKAPISFMEINSSGLDCSSIVGLLKSHVT